MALRWLFSAAVFSYLFSAERIADQLLRDEADSFLNRRHGARESEQEKRSKALAARGVQETPNGTRTDVKVGLPKCSDGILKLDGVYEVKEVVLIEEPSCQVVGSAELLLSAPVRFQGSVVFAGQLNVKAAGEGGKISGPCIAVEGNFTLHPEARLSLQGCENQALGMAGYGGCLRVGGDAQLLGGQLLLRECKAEAGANYGGGISVGGTLQIRNATIDAEGCFAAVGGALYAGRHVNVSGGNVTTKESTAKENGGAIAAGSVAISGGSVTITESTATSDGGAIAADRMAISGGNVIIKICTAHGKGGAIYARQHMNFSGGNVTLNKSLAWKNGGAIYTRQYNVSGGNVTIKESTTKHGSGGAIAANSVAFSGGNVIIKESTAGLTGGAISADSMAISGGNVTIKESRANKTGGAIFARQHMNVFGGNVTIKESSASEGSGGTIYAGSMAISGSNVTIQKSIAKMENGGAIYAESMAFSSGNMTIKESMACLDGGAIYTQQHMNVFGGNVTIKESTARDGHGGALYAQSMAFSGGSMTIKESAADFNGGAIAAGSMAISAGNMTIMQSTARDGHGGAIYAPQHMNVSGGNVNIKESTAWKLAGAIYAGSMAISGGNVTIQKSTAKESHGGAIYAGSMAISGGNVTIQKSTAKESHGGAIYAGRKESHGGAIYAMQHMNVSGGNVNIKESTAEGDGGAIKAESMAISGGNVTIKKSMNRDGSGGAIYAQQHMNVSGGNVTVKGSTARWSGGAIKADSMAISGGNMTIKESTAKLNGGAISAHSIAISGGNVTIKESLAKLNGGCIYTNRTFEQSNGAVSLQGCRARRRGGGMFSRHNITIEDTAMLTIRDSLSDRGGGIFASRVSNKAQQLHVSSCSATSHGGCFYVTEGAELTTPLLLRGCKAKGSGGAIYLQQGSLVGKQMSCSQCHSPTSGCLHLEDGEASIGSLLLGHGSRLVPASPNIVAAGDDANVTLGTADCREVPGCTFAVAQMRLARLLCQRGESRQFLPDSDSTACRECPMGNIRLVAVDEEDARCTPCPNMGNLTIVCTSTELRLPPGYMVDFNRTVATNLSAWYRCPNEMACRGGHFNASSVPGERAQELVPMCEEGYRGPGCTSCAEGHARADADILRCIPCANWTTSPKQVVWYVSFFLSKNLALLVSAVGSVEGSGNKRAASATLLNQAMSFAAVAAVTMSGAMQTDTFKHDLNNAAQVALQLLALPASVAQGQGSSDAGSGSMSGQCLLQLLHTDDSVHYVHALMSLWPAVLVAGLAVIKGGWLAAVVGSNVFLPAFIAGFGKYLVAFRLRPESENEALHLDFLPPGPQMSSHVPLRIAAVLGAIVAFSALSVCSWIYAVRTRSPEKTRPHVAYLIQAYRPECAIWEVERLIRKVVLALIATVLPVTLSPALQMEAVTLVLIASLVAHLYFWPYQADDWNRAEIGLLIVSLTITGMTTCLIANDLHWAKSTLTQRVLVFLICSIAGGICVVMMVAFSLAYLAERRQRAEAKKEEASAARPSVAEKGDRG